VAIGVVTDSASDLPPELAAELGIKIVPLEVRMGDISPAELSRASAAEFWAREQTATDLAETAAPSPGDFLAAYSELAAAGCTGVICVTLSSRLSATHQAALAAVGDAGPEVVVLDSCTATMGEGIVAIAAAEAARRDEQLPAVVAATQRAIADVSVYGTLDTLDNLRRGGRIGGAQAFIGSLLSIKPVIEVRDGVVEGESKQRTRARSLRYLADKVAAAGPLDRLAVVHAAATDVQVFVDLLRAAGVSTEPIVTLMGPVIGAHTGSGTSKRSNLVLCRLPATRPSQATGRV
jgi:DegV family protein with EDD domain